MGSSNVQFQSRTLDKINVIQRVMEGILNRPVTADEVVLSLIDSFSVTPKTVKKVVEPTKKTLKATIEMDKLPVKKKSNSVALKPINWSGFNWERFFDGEVHVVTSQEIREFLGWGKSVKNSLVLNKFQRRIGICAMANKLKLRSHVVKTGPMAGKAIEVQLY